MDVYGIKGIKCGVHPFQELYWREQISPVFPWRELLSCGDSAVPCPPPRSLSGVWKWGMALLGCHPGCTGRIWWCSKFWAKFLSNSGRLGMSSPGGFKDPILASLQVILDQPPSLGGCWREGVWSPPLSPLCGVMPLLIYFPWLIATLAASLPDHQVASVF